MTEDDNPKDDRPFHVRMEELIRKHSRPHDNAPKLKHKGKCEIYALLHSGFDPKVAARMFKVSLSTVSHIGGCRDDDRKSTTFEMVPGHYETVGGPKIKHRNMNRKPRYQEVAEEYETLGDDEFKRQYLTKELARRADGAEAEIRAEKAEKRKKRGYWD